jgi:uncharacterized protein (DUF1684 family)
MADGLAAAETLGLVIPVERCRTVLDIFNRERGISAWWTDRRWRIKRRHVPSEQPASGIDGIRVEAATFGLVAEPPHTCMFITSL